jgi:hypothetical protein
MIERMLQRVTGIIRSGMAIPVAVAVMGRSVDAPVGASLELGRRIAVVSCMRRRGNLPLVCLRRETAMLRLRAGALRQCRQGDQ